MSIYDHPDNPIPEGAVAGFIAAEDGRQLRVARWLPKSAQKRGTICIFQGRAEFIEKYYETVRDLLVRGFADCNPRLARSGRFRTCDPQLIARPYRRFQRVWTRSRGLHDTGRAAELPAAVLCARPLHGRPHSSAQCAQHADAISTLCAVVAVPGAWRLWRLRAARTPVGAGLPPGSG